MYANSDQTRNKVTTRQLLKMKKSQQPIAMLTCYDASFAAIEEAAGVDVILVGDSLGMVIQGHDTTLKVSVDDIVYHCKAVANGLDKCMLLADMPFMSYHNIGSALGNAARMMQEGGAQMVKLEGGAEQVHIVEALAAQGIPVCAHLGLKPQSVHKLGGYLVQGRGEAAALKMLEEATLLEAAGADLLLLECVPALLAKQITAAVGIPVIGIGAGAGCDGQVLVLQDILGITPGKPPSFSHNFMTAGRDIQGALQAYVNAVQTGSFPTDDHCFI